MDDVIGKLYAKLESHVKRLRDGNSDDHDILPGLLWVLLEFNRSHRDDLGQLRERAEKTLAEMSGLTKSIQDECEKLQYNTSESLVKTGDDLKARIGSLAQTLQEESEKLRYQLENVTDSTGTLLKSSNEELKETLRQTTIQLQKLVGTNLDRMTEMHQSSVRRTDNKLKWMLIGSIVHIILIAILMFLLFARQINLWLTHWMS